MPGLRRTGRALRLAAGLARAVAVELVVGRAILARANQIALFALSDRVPAALERLLLRPGCIDGRPTDMADIIVLLQRGNLLRCVGCISLPASDSCLPLREAGALGRLVNAHRDESLTSVKACRRLTGRSSPA